MPDREIRKLARGGEFRFVDVMNVVGHSLFDRAEAALHFFVRAFNHDLHSSIREILDEAGDVVPHGDVLGGVPETYALHAAAEVADVAMKDRRLNHRFEHRTNIITTLMRRAKKNL